MSDLPVHKDVVIAEVGAVAALGGLVLVFLGVLVTTYQTLLGAARREKLDQLRRAGWFALQVFLLGLISATVSTAWLVVGGGDFFYATTLFLFFLELAGLVLVAAYSWKVLLHH